MVNDLDTVVDTLTLNFEFFLQLFWILSIELWKHFFMYWQGWEPSLTWCNERVRALLVVQYILIFEVIRIWQIEYRIELKIVVIDFKRSHVYFRTVRSVFLYLVETIPIKNLFFQPDHIWKVLVNYYLLVLLILFFRHLRNQLSNQSRQRSLLY